MMRCRIIFVLSLAILCMFVIPVSATTGGPDAFGYTFIDSNSGGPAYNWIEISGTGTQILASSDDSTVIIPLDFDFNYYGTDYSQLNISTNGLIFTENSYFLNQPIGNSPSAHGFIAPYWDDLVTVDPADAIYYQTLGNAPNRMFVVEWKDNWHYQSSTSGITFEAILHEGSNNIKFQYLDVDFGTVSGAIPRDLPPYNNGGSATVGIENQIGDDGLQYSYNSPVINPNLAILFKYPAGSIPSIPEFPLLALPAAMIIGFLGAVLLIQRTREH